MSRHVRGIDNLLKNIEKLWVIEVANVEKGKGSQLYIDSDADYVAKALRVCEMLYHFREGSLIGNMLLVRNTFILIGNIIIQSNHPFRAQRLHF